MLPAEHTRTNLSDIYLLNTHTTDRTYTLHKFKSRAQLSVGEKTSVRHQNEPFFIYKGRGTRKHEEKRKKDMARKGEKDRFRKGSCKKKENAFFFPPGDSQKKKNQRKKVLLKRWEF